MIIFGILLFLIVWAVLVLRSIKKHNVQYFDEHYAEDTPMKFTDTIKGYHQFKHDLKQLNKKHKRHTNG